MKLLTVRRAGDGTFHQATFHFMMEADMKLKCTFCVEQHGNAVKTDQLVLVQTPTGDKLACMNHKRQYENRSHSHENSNSNASRN